MGYYIISSGRNNKVLFLVDRRIVRNRWWSSDVSDAILFRKRSAAEYSKSKLYFRNPEIIESTDPIVAISQESSMSDEEHPFSPDALGQE